jgi:tetratricopeptide (TPR) repeat protein
MGWTVKDENAEHFLGLINAIIPSLNGHDPDKLIQVDYGIDKLADDKYYGPKVMAKVRYLILLYVAGRLERFRIFGLQEGNNIYFSVRNLEKIANDRCFRPEKIKFERSRAIGNRYLPRVGDGIIIHKQREVPTKKGTSKPILTDLVALTEKGKESCERIVEVLLLGIPEEKRPKQKSTRIVPTDQTSKPDQNFEECQSYGLNWLRMGNFEYRKNTETDFEIWKKGFDLPSIMAKRELRREGLIAYIKSKLENQGKLLIVGSSKTTILMELMCDYSDAGYEVFYNYGTADIRNVDGLVNFVKDILRSDKKILVAIDNAHSKETYPIFYFVDKLSYPLLGSKLKIIMTTRKPIRKLIAKLRAGPNFIYHLPDFTKEEIKELVKRYSETDGDEKIVDEIAEEIYNYTKGDPLMVKFYILDRRLEQDVTEMSDRYLRSPVERKTMLICSILDISSTEITDKLFEKCGVLETAHNLDGSILHRNSDGLWKTKGRRWAMKMFSFFFDNKSRTQLEGREQDLKDSLVALFQIGEEKITFSAIKTLHYLVTINFVPKAAFDSVFQELKSQIPTRSLTVSLCLSDAYSITDAYFSLKKNIEVSERLDRLVIDSKLNEAIRCYDLGDYEETMKYCDEALEINPSSIRALFIKRQAMVKIL